MVLGQTSFFPRIARDWKGLPQQTVKALIHDAFFFFSLHKGVETATSKTCTFLPLPLQTGH